MSFNHKYNSDDAIIRACIIGLINELNNRISYKQVWSDNRTQTVRVPFYYAMSGDERFLQDYFSNWSDCAPDFIEGNVDPIPRGTVFLNGTSVLSANLTSRFVRGYYTKEIDGELKKFNSHINSIPIQLNFGAEIIVDTTLDSFKIVQSIMATMYRTLVYSVNFQGFRVPIQAGFPDAYEMGKQFEFVYGATDRVKISFSIEVQAYLPITDDKTEMFAGNRIDEFADNYSMLAHGASVSVPETAVTQTILNASDVMLVTDAFLLNNSITSPDDYSWNTIGNNLFVPTAAGKIKLDALSDANKLIFSKLMKLLMKSND